MGGEREGKQGENVKIKGREPRIGCCSAKGFSSESKCKNNEGREKKKVWEGTTLASWCPLQGGNTKQKTLKPTQKKMAQRGRLLEKFRHLG
jgi:hypothetical protein